MGLTPTERGLMLKSWPEDFCQMGDIFKRMHQNLLREHKELAPLLGLQHLCDVAEDDWFRNDDFRNQSLLFAQSIDHCLQAFTNTNAAEASHSEWLLKQVSANRIGTLCEAAESA